MYFKYLLDALFGPREILYALECTICGDDEVYFLDPKTQKQIGRACQGCNYVQKFDFSPSQG
ncbi:acyltransferase [Ammoniphilus sp. YIM 78166]|uniref:acyltransferase n=1 Tax=Ammoniphilus sp. YIM 78166 TaxID=1644106 RepID=UPI00106F5FD9|nr:acyltransferase [Ammoniphilus sp. YIM 78166]